MNCKLCGNEFNLSSRKPKLLPKCGDSICCECLDKLRAKKEDFACPTDGIIYSKTTEIFDNAYIINCLTAQRPASNACSKHSKDLELFCLDCSAEICPSCVLFGEHKTHQYEQLSEYRAKFSSKLLEVQKKLEQIERNLSAKMADASVQVHRTIEEKHAQIDSRFEELSLELLKTKETVKDEVSGIYITMIDEAERLKAKVRETLLRISEAAKGKAHPKEDAINKELRELERQYDANELFRPGDSLATRAELIFSRAALDQIARFVRLDRPYLSRSPPRSAARSRLDQPEEDNLLQESFKELMKGSSDSPAEDMERNERTPNSRILPAKNLSPISAFSGTNSIRSLNKKPDDHKNPLLNQTLMDSRKLSLSPSNNISMMVKSPQTHHTLAISPLKAKTRGGPPNKENYDAPTNLKSLGARSAPTERIMAQLETVASGKSSLLDLSSSGLDDRALERLSARFAELKGCKTIKLSGNSLTELGLKTLLKAIKDLQVEYLFLNNNSLRDTALDYIISFKKYNSVMKCVYMNNNAIAVSAHKTAAKMRMLEDSNISIVL